MAEGDVFQRMLRNLPPTHTYGGPTLNSNTVAASVLFVNHGPSCVQGFQARGNVASARKRCRHVLCSLWKTCLSYLHVFVQHVTVLFEG